MQIATNIKIPFNTTLQIHPEFDGYTGDTIKQGGSYYFIVLYRQAAYRRSADVVLLGYPLRWPMTPQIRLNDLVYYQNRTDPNGPAMTYGIVAFFFLLSCATNSYLPKRNVRCCMAGAWTALASG